MVKSTNRPCHLDTFASRFAKERHRIGYSVAALARVIGVARQSIMNIETGHSQPKSDMLIHAARVGMDVQYIITGVPSRDLEAIEKAIGYSTIDEELAA